MKVAIIGHRRIDISDKLLTRTKEEIVRLIQDGADTFIFGSRSEFDDLCYGIVTSLKDSFNIQRIYVRSSFQYINDDYRNYLLSMYEETFFPDSVEGAGVLSYVKRNETMIDMCDVLLTYNKGDYGPISGHCKTHSGTAIAVAYARNKNKIVINVLE